MDASSPAGGPAGSPAGTPGAAPASTAEGLRFAFGTLTVLPVRVARWDRHAARAGMVCAPAVGLVVGGLAAAAGAALLLGGASALLAGVASTAVPAVLTRGLHLDGLADVADGLGSGKPADAALRVMKQSDIGPFGVVTLVFVLLAQVAALAELYARGWAAGAAGAVAAAVAARGALTLAARRGVPAARPEGLGAAVAETVPRAAALTAAGCCAVLSAGGAWPVGRTAAAAAAAGTVLGLCAAELLLRHCVRRFGGVTGDVFGGVAEAAASCTLVVAVLL
ncbi:adenosylcobinamide-GDP ribazoletransferase [Streptomyces qinglanensis]|uniref:Adenosylcobinamide-GDP ribazoletransferase n=1 Tax=Streptomyces qinglanensis TaxID=943816 RepID=A0A1H9NJU3_9ACTN|nr:adenosylcobinamide-GDP ribazoletransferase [Streptomyces qinglanensis]SER36206.1 adenosylcobinamide-GDP ribazoletransferase [Streptomyces qinglanensis]